jgi:hypothetical protein
MSKTKVASLSVFDTVSACNKGARIELLTPAGDGSGIFIPILGRDSDVYKTYEREQRDSMNRKIMLARKRGQDLRLDSAEMSEEKEIDLLVRLTMGAGVPWENMPSFDGKGLLEFNKENVTLVYVKFPAIRRQMDDASGDMQNFIKS